MNKRSNALAERIEQGAEALATFAEGLSGAEWQTVVPNDQRPVSVLVHHVADVYSLEVDLAQPARQVGHVDARPAQVLDERLIVQLYQHVANVEHHVANHRPTTPAGAPSRQAR